MKTPASLQTRLAMGLGVALSLLWLVAAAATVEILRRDMQAVFDSSLQETAQRLLPLAVLEIVNRDGDATAQQLAPIRPHAELFTYIVRDPTGAVLMASHAADPTLFPAWDGPGFRETSTHRFYGEDTMQGSIRLTVAEPLAIRQDLLHGMSMRQALPLLLVLPLTLAVVWAVLRLGMADVRRFRSSLAARDARDFAPFPIEGLPFELRPMAETLNGLLARLAAAFEAERSFAANAAHELRTPLAGAIAQAQWIKRESPDRASAERALAIEESLKRLTRTSEGLMQLARAEGGRLRVNDAYDIRPILSMLVADLSRLDAVRRIRLSLPDAPVQSDLDPDALAILARNLVENAVRHGRADQPVEVTLSACGMFRVVNACERVAADELTHLTERFTRRGEQAGGGLGLAIVAAIAERTGSALLLASPRPGSDDGFSAAVQLPLA